MEVARWTFPRRGLLAVAAVAMLAFAAPAHATVGQARTSGPQYDRNPSVVSFGGTTYLFFARSQQDCNRLTTMMGALQLVRHKQNGSAFDPSLEVGMLCRGYCFDNGLVMRAVGDRMIVAPPLVMTLAQLDEMVALIRRCLDLTLAEAGREGWL